MFSTFYSYNILYCFIISNYESFIYSIKKKKIDSFFIIKYGANELNKLDPYFGNSKKEIQKPTEISISSKIKLVDIKNQFYYIFYFII